MNKWINILPIHATVKFIVYKSCGNIIFASFIRGFERVTGSNPVAGKIYDLSLFRELWHTKGQFIPKADWRARRAIDSPKKRTNGVWLNYVTTLRGKKNKTVRSFFGRTYGAPFCFWLNLTFNKLTNDKNLYYNFCRYVLNVRKQDLSYVYE